MGVNLGFGEKRAFHFVNLVGAHGYGVVGFASDGRALQRNGYLVAGFVREGAGEREQFAGYAGEAAAIQFS